MKFIRICHVEMYVYIRLALFINQQTNVAYAKHGKTNISEIVLIQNKHIYICWESNPALFV